MLLLPDLRALAARIRALERRLPQPAPERGPVRYVIVEGDTAYTVEHGERRVVPPEEREEWGAQRGVILVELVDLVPDERTLAARAADVVAEVADRAIAAVKDVTERVMTPEPEPELPDFGGWSYEALYARARQQIAMRERLAIEAELNRRARVDRGDEPARRVDVEREAADRPSWAAAGSIVH